MIRHAYMCKHGSTHRYTCTTLAHMLTLSDAHVHTHRPMDTATYNLRHANTGIPMCIQALTLSV